ncbi:hypothetical protein D7X87_11810 [bacterium D16-54]|nr:hypothetical protein D7X87_11810 [bacterium D16-54]RKJ14232.1 hypothetical protein D7X65_12405 [bacterium D16-56]
MKSASVVPVLPDPALGFCAVLKGVPVWDMLPGDVAQRLPAGKRRNPDRNERTKRSEMPPRMGAGTTAEGTGQMNTETIPKHDNLTGIVCPVRNTKGDFRAALRLYFP